MNEIKDKLEADAKKAAGKILTFRNCVIAGIILAAFVAGLLL